MLAVRLLRHFYCGSARAIEITMPAITLIVNGTERKTDAAPGESLLSVLRYRLGLTGTKYGCGESECGACTVLLNGTAVRSCTMRARNADGKKIVTIEGLAQDGKLSPLQQAFLDEEAFQCGYCTAGMILAATALLHEHPHPSPQQIVEYMDGNI